MNESLSILVVDDDEGVCDAVSQTLEQLGHSVRSAHTLAAARSEGGVRVPDAVFLDLRLPDGNGVDYLAELKRDHPHVEVIVITGYPDVDLAVRSMRLGATDLLEKPFTKEQIAGVIQGVVGLSMVVREVVDGSSPRAPQLIGNSPSLLAACHKIRLLAGTPSTTGLILGESGTGKELAARAIHACSSRATQPFVAINCAALTETLLEAELFGYEKGAFTGALDGKPGLFEVADKGTLFLDEIGEMDVSLQAKLLRVLQEHAILRVGGLQERTVDVRVVASTNRDLQERVAQKEFREDLFYRLNVMPIVMPPLRDRDEDVILLAHHFLKVFAKDFSKALTGFSRPVLERFSGYGWPGNIRELRNVVEHAAIVTRGSRIELEDLMIGAGASGRSPRQDGEPSPARSPDAEVVLELPDYRLAGAEVALIRQALKKKGYKCRLSQSFRPFLFIGAPVAKRNEVEKGELL